MQKFLKFFMLLLVTICLIGCGDKGNNGGKKDKDYYQIVMNAKKEYSESASGNVYIEIIGDVTVTTEFVYNFNGNLIDTLKHVQKVGEDQYEAYVKDNVAYVNDKGVKTKANIFDMEQEQIVELYGFDGVTEEFFKTFDKAFFDALKAESDKDGVVTLNFDLNKYVLNVDGLSDEEMDEVIERHTNITENIKSIVVKITYSNDKMTKFESTWTDKNDKVSKINMELRGTGKQEITFPTDLDSYVKR